MDYRNFSPNKCYVDESLLPQGPRKPRTSTPRVRRPNPYQNSPDGGLGGSGSPPYEGSRNKSWRRSNDSWRGRDSSRNSSFNSSSNSPFNSPSQWFQGGYRREQDFNSSAGLKNIAAYYHPSMMENPWLHLEEPKPSENAQSVSCNADSMGSKEGDEINESSDQEALSPDVLIESELITKHSQDCTKDEASFSDTGSSQKSSG